MNTLLVVPWDEKRGGVQAVVNTVAGWLEQQDHSVLMLHNGQSLRLKFGATKLGYRGVKLRLSWPFATQSRGILSAMVFPLVFLLILVQLVWLLRTRRIDIVNLHYPIDNFIYFAICRRLLPIRLVTSIHGRDAFERDRPLKKYSRALAYIVRSSDLIILPSDAYRRMLATSLPTLHDRIVYIHNSVNPSLFKPADAGSAAALSPYILCIAELQEYKGIDVLLHATQLLLETDPDLVLILAGDGPLRQKLGGFGARARHPSSRIVSWHAGSARTGYAASRMPRRGTSIEDGAVRDCHSRGIGMSAAGCGLCGRRYSRNDRTRSQRAPGGA